jgi:GT2 family glycosyltransferase
VTAAGGTGLRRVSVAVVSWNGRRHLETLLPALAAQRDPGVPWEVLVFDNGSKDGTVEWLRREWGSGGRPAVRVVASPVNVGFCAANNRLVEAAEGDAVALLNNDTRPRPEWLAALVAALAGAPADVAAVSGMIVDWAGERLDFGRGVMTFDGHAFQLGFRRPLAGPGAA